MMSADSMTSAGEPETSGMAEPGGIGFDEAIRFAWAEADMLDSHDYQAWQSLWTASGRYVIPLDRDGDDYGGSLNIAYDDATMRAARVKRLCGGFAMSTAPAARTVRTISRFRIMAAAPDSLTIKAGQHLVEYKYERTRVLAADVTYRLVRQEQALKLDLKVVRLINSDDALHGIGYLF